MTKKPLASRRSSRRPSTEKRTAASTATRRPARAIVVWSTSRSSRQVPARLQGRIGQEQSQAGAEEARQQDLAQEPGLVLVSPFAHFPLVGRTAAADKGHAVATRDSHRRRPPADPRGALVAAPRPRLRRGRRGLGRGDGGRRGGPPAAGPRAARPLDARNGRPDGAAAAPCCGARVRGRRAHGVRDRGRISSPRSAAARPATS